MLHHTEIIGLCKKAQQSFFQDLSFGASQPTMADLLQHVMLDRGLTEPQRQQVIQQLQGLLRGSQPSTPLSALMSSGLGGILGQQIGKYFGMGMLGQLLSAAAGFGLGRTVYDRLNPAIDPYRGYTFIH